MHYEEFRRHLGKAGLSVKEFASLVKTHQSSLSNYSKSEEIPAHWAVIAALMGEMADNGLDFRPVLAKIDIAPKKPRGAAPSAFFNSRRSLSEEPNLEPETQP
jgi:hypothetical protein